MCCSGVRGRRRWWAQCLSLCVCLAPWKGTPVSPLISPAGGARALPPARGEGRALLPRMPAPGHARAAMHGRAAALRLSGGFDKIADDDPDYEELHNLLYAYDDDGAQPPLTLKEKMNRQVEHTTECLERMSHIVARAAERATRHVQAEAEGEAEGSDFRNSLDGSSGQGADDGFEGGLEDYFEYMPEKAPGSCDDAGRPALVLGAEMLRQPLGMPKKMRQGKVKYEQAAMEFVKQAEEGRRQWGKLHVLGIKYFA